MNIEELRAEHLPLPVVQPPSYDDYRMVMALIEQRPSLDDRRAALAEAFPTFAAAYRGEL